MGDMLPPALLVAAAAAVAEVVVVEEAVVGSLELQMGQRVELVLWSSDPGRCPIASPVEHIT